MYSFMYQCGCGIVCDFTHLNLCDSCHLVSCYNCQFFEVIGKYCPQCLGTSAKVDSTRCYKNCFQCPRCDMFLAVTSKKQDAGAMSRSYAFKCQGCDWQYCTPVTPKIKSLTKYIMELECKSDYNSRFDALREFYQVKTNLDKIKSNPRLIRLDKIDMKGNSTWWRRLANGESVWNLIDEESESTVSADSEYEFPRFCKLRAKFKYSCPYCKRTLSREDSNSSRWLKLSPAVAQLPCITVLSSGYVKNGEDVLERENVMALLIQNPRIEHGLSLKINSEESLLISAHQLKIPAVSIEKANRSDYKKDLMNVLRLMPSYQLESSSRVDKLMRVEHTRRLGDLNRRNNQDETGLIDSGESWIVVPVTKINSKSRYELDLMISFEDWEVSIRGFISLS